MCVTACVCICVCMCVCCLSDNIHCVFAICLLVILLFCLLEPEIAQQFAVRTCLQYKRIRKGYSPWAFLLQCNWLTVAMTGLSIKTASGKRSHCRRLLIHQKPAPKSMLRRVNEIISAKLSLIHTHIHTEDAKF